MAASFLAEGTLEALGRCLRHLTVGLGGREKLDDEQEVASASPDSGRGGAVDDCCRAGG